MDLETFVLCGTSPRAHTANRNGGSGKTALGQGGAVTSKRERTGEPHYRLLEERWIVLLLEPGNEACHLPDRHAVS
jgi:hypothetical protein